jgi:hypothetical protein
VEAEPQQLFRGVEAEAARPWLPLVEVEVGEDRLPSQVAVGRMVVGEDQTATAVAAAEAQWARAAASCRVMAAAVGRLQVAAEAEGYYLLLQTAVVEGRSLAARVHSQ